MPWQVLQYLLSGQCVSGEMISTALGISRAAVWKRIGLLRESGFEIRAVPSWGYHLEDIPDLSVEYVKAGLLGGLWQNVLLFNKVDSTNEIAAGRGFEPGTIIIADCQSQGKGRLGRTWVSPPGANVYMSLVIKPELTARDAPLLTLLAAVSCVVGIAGVTGLNVQIKWPNDLMVKEKKLGGILTETRSDPDRILQAVIGIGINVNMGREALPVNLRSVATSMRIETDRLWRRSSLIVAILREFERGWRILRDIGKDQLLRQLRVFSSTIGRRISVSIGNERLSGVAEGIDDDGLLLMRLATGELRLVNSGDIHQLR